MQCLSGYRQRIRNADQGFRQGLCQLLKMCEQRPHHRNIQGHGEGTNYVTTFIKSFYKRNDISMLELTPDFIKEFATCLTTERNLKNAAWVQAYRN